VTGLFFCRLCRTIIGKTKEDKSMAKETIIIDGVRYYTDRLRSCRGCFFWKNRKVGCTLKKENCYYLAESPKPTY
jgi:hypothetical protein